MGLKIWFQMKLKPNDPFILLEAIGIINEACPLLALTTSGSMGTKVGLSPGYSRRCNDNYELIHLLAASHPAPPDSLSKHTLHNCPLLSNVVGTTQSDSGPLSSVVTPADVALEMSSGVWRAGGGGGELELEHGGPGEGFPRGRARPTFQVAWHQTQVLTLGPPQT